MHKTKDMPLPEVLSAESPGVQTPDPDTIAIMPTTKRRIFRNLFLLSFGYFLFFTSFFPLANLQSTMNAAGGIGVISQAVIYLCSMFSCLFAELIMEKFGTKTTYTVSLLLSVPYIASNFSLRWDAMLTASVLYGLLSGPLNASVSCYVDEMSVRYAKLTEDSLESVKALFFGGMMIFGQLTMVVGNIIVFYSLHVGRTPPPRNSSSVGCGVHFDPAEEVDGTNSNLDPPSDHDRYVLTGTFVLLCLVAAGLGLLIDPLRNDVREIKGCRPLLRRITNTIKHLKNPHQLLLLPITVYLGMEAAFYGATVTEAYIACSWGVHDVGFVTISLGACGAVMAILVGPLVKCVGQMSVFILAALVSGANCVFLFLWQPSPDVPAVYFVFAGVWGMMDTIWWSQVGALYGLLFHDEREAAFSNFFFWSFLGYFLSFSYANAIGVSYKIVIMMSFLVVGITLYIIGQVKIKYFTDKSGYVRSELI